MNPVATVIRRNLLAGRAIAIPNFGTIASVRRGASVTDNGQRISAPWHEVVISQSPAVSIVDYIASDLEVDKSQATEQYNQFIERSIHDDCLMIQDVGFFGVHDYDIELVPEFASLLNPQTEDKIVIRRSNDRPKTQLRPTRENNTVMVVISIMAAIVAAAYLAYYYWPQIEAMMK